MRIRKRGDKDYNKRRKDKELWRKKERDKCKFSKNKDKKFGFVGLYKKLNKKKAKNCGFKGSEKRYKIKREPFFVKSFMEKLPKHKLKSKKNNSNP